MAIPIGAEAGSETLATLFDGVFELVGRLQKTKRLSGFFFMRKPPGLRLRFAFKGRSDEALDEIRSAMKSLTRRKVVGKWFPTVYEPETFKFGGRAAMDAVHAHFYADSLAWWHWEQLRRSAQTSIASKVLSLGVLNDLFARFSDGPEEVWDIWCRVAALHGASAVGDGTPVPIIGLDELFGRVTPREQAILRRHALRNQTLARRFAAIGASGKLLFANRLVLPHVALYHWNRYGFSPDDRASMFSPMVNAWSPNRSAATNT